MDTSPRIINLCPHPIKVFSSNSEEEPKTYHPSGTVIRLRTKEQENYRNLDGVPCAASQVFEDIDMKIDNSLYGDVLGAESKSILIVSMPVGEFLKNRPSSRFPEGISIIGPDSSPEFGVRNESGTIIGTKRFVVYVAGDYFKKNEFPKVPKEPVIEEDDDFRA